jgi:diguanylate cyclase (GGDEF)-like protein
VLEVQLLHAAMVVATPELAAVLDVEGRAVFVSPGNAAAWGRGSESRPLAILDVVHPQDRQTVESALSKLFAGEETVITLHVRFQAEDAWQLLRTRLTRFTAGVPTVSYVVVHLVDDGDAGSRAAEGTDRLTGLPSRMAVLDYLDGCVDRREPGSLLICDLDQFRLINDSLGHDAGDVVLVATADRLRRSVHPGDLVGRLSGDEFAVVCLHAEDGRKALIEAIREAAREPLTLGTTEHVLTVSIGVTPLSGSGGTIEALAAAGQAVYVAKERGRDRAELFDAGFRETALTTLRRTSELRHAASNGELLLHYQPIVDLVTAETRGYEALLRWEHPTEGLLNAGQFIGLAESSGLVKELTLPLFERACRAASHLAGQPGPRPFVAFNLSATQLADPGLVNHLQGAIDQAGIHRSQITIEITETALLTDIEQALPTLHQLRDSGVSVALDDFGTGYSSLVHLRQLPVDTVKIDRAFVAGMTRNNDDFAIVASVVHLATSLGLTCVAEGVESFEQVKLLQSLDCQMAQGFLWSPAVPLDELPVKAHQLSAGEPDPQSETAPVDGRAQARILRLHHSGASLHAIAAALNNSGERTARGVRWQPKSVAQVIARAAYPGLASEQPPT